MRTVSERALPRPFGSIGAQVLSAHSLCSSAGLRRPTDGAGARWSLEPFRVRGDAGSREDPKGRASEDAATD